MADAFIGDAWSVLAPANAAIVRVPRGSRYVVLKSSGKFLNSSIRAYSFARGSGWIGLNGRRHVVDLEGATALFLDGAPQPGEIEFFQKRPLEIDGDDLEPDAGHLFGYGGWNCLAGAEQQVNGMGGVLMTQSGPNGDINAVAPEAGLDFLGKGGRWATLHVDNFSDTLINFRVQFNDPVRAVSWSLIKAAVAAGAVYQSRVRIPTLNAYVQSFGVYAQHAAGVTKQVAGYLLVERGT